MMLNGGGAVAPSSKKLFEAKKYDKKEEKVKVEGALKVFKKVSSPQTLETLVYLPYPKLRSCEFPFDIRSFLSV